MRILILAVILQTLTSCATTFNGIAITHEEKQFPTRFDTVEVVSEDLPFFLGPIVMSNLAVAIAELGIEPVSGTADARVIVRYVQVPISPMSLEAGADQTPLEEAIEHSGETRFIARLEVRLQSTGTSEVLWQGAIERIHNVWPGEYMHTGAASPAILDAFRAMLAAEN